MVLRADRWAEVDDRTSGRAGHEDARRASRAAHCEADCGQQQGPPGPAVVQPCPVDVREQHAHAGGHRLAPAAGENRHQRTPGRVQPEVRPNTLFTSAPVLFGNRTLVLTRLPAPCPDSAKNASPSR
jgi:hypothetical protein